MADLGNIEVKFSTDNTGLSRGIDEAQSKISTFGSFVSSHLVVTLGEVAHIVKEVFGAIPEQINKSSEAINQLYLNAQKINGNVETFQELSFAASRAGVSTDSLRMSMFLLQKNVGEFENGSAPDKMTAAFKAIGLSAKDLQGLSIDDQFKKVVSGLSGIGDANLRANAAFNILGRGAKEVSGLINSGLDENIKKFNELGLKLSSSQVLDVHKFQESKEILGTIWDGFWNKVTAFVSPAMTTLIEQLTDFITKSGGIDAVAKTFADTLVNGLKEAYEWIERLIKGYKELKGVLFSQNLASNGGTDGANLLDSGLRDPNGGDILAHPINTISHGISEGWGALKDLFGGGPSGVNALGFGDKGGQLLTNPASTYSQQNQFGGMGAPLLNLTIPLDTFKKKTAEASDNLEALAKSAKDAKDNAFTRAEESKSGFSQQMDRITSKMVQLPNDISPEFDDLAAKITKEVNDGSKTDSVLIQTQLAQMQAIASGKEGVGSGTAGNTDASLGHYGIGGNWIPGDPAQTVESSNHLAQNQTMDELYKWLKTKGGGQDAHITLTVTPTPYAMIEWANDPKSKLQIFKAVESSVSDAAAASHTGNSYSDAG